MAASKERITYSVSIAKLVYATSIRSRDVVAVSRVWKGCPKVPLIYLLSPDSSGVFSPGFGRARLNMAVKRGQFGAARMSAMTPAKCSLSLGFRRSGVNH